MTVPATQQQTASDLVLVAERALRDPAVDVEKLQRILDIIEMQTNRQNERAFTTALVRSQAAMEHINSDASNPQTRSRYATYAALDRECRPHYIKNGLAPSFNTEPSSKGQDYICVIGMLGHVDGHVRRYSIDMPIDSQGFQGKAMMTRTHATGSAFSYGKRYLLAGMFNLVVDDDDDGNAGPRRAPTPSAIRPQPVYRSPQAVGADALETIDPETGEVIDQHIDPYTIEMNAGSTWSQFLEPLQRYIVHANTIQEIDDWKFKNQDLLLKLKEAKPQLYKLFEQNIEPRILELTPQ
jgi:hypothetical protein